MQYYVILMCDGKEIDKVFDVVCVTNNYDAGVRFCKYRNEAQTDFYYKIKYTRFYSFK